jgi:hypothetical protein
MVADVKQFADAQCAQTSGESAAYTHLRSSAASEACELVRAWLEGKLSAAQMADATEALDTAEAAATAAATAASLDGSNGHSDGLSTAVYRAVKALRVDILRAAVGEDGKTDLARAFAHFGNEGG